MRKPVPHPTLKGVGSVYGAWNPYRYTIMKSLNYDKSALVAGSLAIKLRQAIDFHCAVAAIRTRRVGEKGREHVRKNSLITRHLEDHLKLFIHPVAD